MKTSTRMKKNIILLVTLIAVTVSMQAQTVRSRINKSLYSGTTVTLEATNDSVKFYEFGKPGNIIVSGDYDYVYGMLNQMRNFTRDCRWGDKTHITEHLSIERRGLTGPRAYRVINDSIGTEIYTGFNSLSESHHAVWVHRPSNADRIAAERRAARKAAENQNGEFQPPFDGPMGDWGGGFPGGFGGGFGPGGF